MIPVRFLSTLLPFILISLLEFVPVISFSQDSIRHKKVLIVGKKDIRHKDVIISDSNATTVLTHVFEEGDKVAVKTNDNKYLTGKIKNITDSSILIKENSVMINQIKMICVHRGIEPTILGLSLVSGGFITSGLIFTCSDVNEYGTSYNWSAALTSAVVGFFAGGGTTLFGIIEMSATKHYSMKKKFVLGVKSINEK